MRTFVFHMSRLGILFCVVSNSSVINHRRRCDFFVLCFGLSSSINVPMWQNLSAEGSASSCSKRFLTGVDSNPRAHSCTRILDWDFSWAWVLRGLGHSALFPSTHFFLSICGLSIGSFFSIQRCNLLNGLCHPYEKICVQTHEYFRVSHVSAGYLLFCALINRSAVGHRWCCDFFCFLRFGLSSSNNVPVWQNLSAESSASSRSKRFLQESDSNPRTHSCTRILDWGISWVWRLRPSAILPGLRRHFSVWSVFFSIG